MAEVVLLVSSVVVLLATTAALLWRVRDPGWVRDSGLAMNASPRATVISFVMGALGSAALVVVGVVWLGGSHVAEGAAVLVLALTGAVRIGVQAWVFRRRLTGPGAPTEDPEA